MFFDDDKPQYPRWEYIDKEKQRRVDEENRRRRRAQKESEFSFLTVIKILVGLFALFVFAPLWPIFLILLFIGDDAMGGGGNWGP